MTEASATAAAARRRTGGSGKLNAPPLPIKSPGDAHWGRDGWTFSTYGGRVSEADALAGAREHLQSRVVKLKLPTIGAQAEDRFVSGF